MTARPLPAGVRGFDCNAPVSHETARSLILSGYRFALRYLPRLTAHARDLSAAEVGVILNAGLAVMGVQHVESAESWSPTDDKGRQYGETAARYAKACGLVAGSTIWLDLEGVAAGGTDQEQTIRYCNYWHDRVKAVGYQPGIYIGWHSGLSPDQMYRRLKFERYWAAYNLNQDEYPAVRGVCLRQRERRPGDVPSGTTLPELDLDVSYVDAKGGVATVHAPDEWDV